jgi:hypothetical protein
VLLPDLLDSLQALNDAEVSDLVIGGHAVGLHDHSRATKDLDVWIGMDPRNRSAVIDALESFGAPRHVVEMVKTAGASEFVFFGLPPQRIHLLQAIPGVDDFERAHERRVEIDLDGVSI